MSIIFQDLDYDPLLVVDCILTLTEDNHWDTKNQTLAAYYLTESHLAKLLVTAVVYKETEDELFFEHRLLEMNLPFVLKPDFFVLLHLRDASEIIVDDPTFLYYLKGYHQIPSYYFSSKLPEFHLSKQEYLIINLLLLPNEGQYKLNFILKSFY